MLKKPFSLFTVLLLAMMMITSSFHAAEAYRGRNAAFVGGVALGALALGAAGAYGRSYQRSCYRGPTECRWVSGGCFINRFGDEICHRGHRECWRTSNCD